jgi:hypothetical protein
MPAIGHGLLLVDTDGDATGDETGHPGLDAARFALSEAALLCSLAVVGQFNGNRYRPIFQVLLQIASGLPVTRKRNGAS